MKNLILLTALAVLEFTASGRSIVIAPSQNITRNAGQTIPLTFTAGGFGGQTAQILLVNAKSWAPGEVVDSIPVVNGVNTRQVVIPWSWETTGPFVLKIVVGSTAVTDKRVVLIRSAVVWPYAGTVFPEGGEASISWVVRDWSLGDYMDIFLHDEDTGESWYVGFVENPYSGRLDFPLPDGVTGNHFRFLLDGYFVYETQAPPDDPGGGQSYIDVVESTQSARIAIR